MKYCHSSCDGVGWYKYIFRKAYYTKNGLFQIYNWKSSLANGKVKVIQSLYRPEVPRGFQEVKVPGLRDSGPEWW